MTRLTELDATGYAQAVPLLAGLAINHLSVAAVLDGSAAGEVRVDSPDRPTIALLEGPEGVYLGGAPAPDTDYVALNEAIDDWAYLHVAREWRAVVDKLLPHPFMLPHPRLAFVITPAPAVEVKLPPGFDAEIAGEFGCRILHRGVEVSRCLPDMRVGDRAEIGVWTRPDYRRRGLALAAARLTLAEAARHGIHAVGWHCHASNIGSAQLAGRLGGLAVGHSVAYSASLPAESPGDLDKDQWVALAEHFDGAARSIGWMSFHAAGAWALAGDEARALLATENLIDKKWSGDPDWLAHHWSLATIARHPRFQRCVERLRDA